MTASLTCTRCGNYPDTAMHELGCATSKPGTCTTCGTRTAVGTATPGGEPVCTLCAADMRIRPYAVGTGRPIAHDHPPYEPWCAERVIDGVLTGTCVAGRAILVSGRARLQSDSLSKAEQPPAPHA